MKGLKLHAQKVSGIYCQVTYTVKNEGGEVHGLLQVKSESTLKEVVGIIRQRVEESYGNMVSLM